MTAPRHQTDHRDVTQREILDWGGTSQGFNGYQALAVAVLRRNRDEADFLEPRNPAFRFWCEAAGAEPEMAAVLFARCQREAVA